LILYIYTNDFKAFGIYRSRTKMTHDINLRCDPETGCPDLSLIVTYHDPDRAVVMLYSAIIIVVGLMLLFYILEALWNTGIPVAKVLKVLPRRHRLRTTP
jgi:hypothetical protein